MFIFTLMKIAAKVVTLLANLAERDTRENKLYFTSFRWMSRGPGGMTVGMFTLTVATTPLTAKKRRSAKVWLFSAIHWRK